MPRLTRTAAALAAAAVLALTAACGPDDPPTTSSTTPPSTTTTSTPSTTTKTETAAEKNARMAGEAVVALWAKLDELAADPNKSLSGLASVASDQALTQWQRNLTLMRGKGQKQVGSAVVEAPTATFDGKTNVYTVKACVDVSKVNVVDKDGKSVVTANRRPRVKYTYQVTESRNAFYVTQDLLQGVPC